MIIPLLGRGGLPLRANPISLPYSSAAACSPYEHSHSPPAPKEQHLLIRLQLDVPDLPVAEEEGPLIACVLGLDLDLVRLSYPACYTVLARAS